MRLTTSQSPQLLAAYLEAKSLMDEVRDIMGFSFIPGEITDEMDARMSSLLDPRFNRLLSINGGTTTVHSPMSSFGDFVVRC